MRMSQAKFIVPRYRRRRKRRKRRNQRRYLRSGKHPAGKVTATQSKQSMNLNLILSYLNPTSIVDVHAKDGIQMMMTMNRLTIATSRWKTSRLEKGSPERVMHLRMLASPLLVELTGWVPGHWPRFGVPVACSVALADLFLQLQEKRDKKPAASPSSDPDDWAILHNDFRMIAIFCIDLFFQFISPDSSPLLMLVLVHYSHPVLCFICVFCSLHVSSVMITLFSLSPHSCLVIMTFRSAAFCNTLSVYRTYCILIDCVLYQASLDLLPQDLGGLSRIFHSFVWVCSNLSKCM